MQFISYIGIIVHENIKSKKGQNFHSNLIKSADGTSNDTKEVLHYSTMALPTSVNRSFAKFSKVAKGFLDTKKVEKL